MEVTAQQSRTGVLGVDDLPAAKLAWHSRSMAVRNS